MDRKDGYGVYEWENGWCYKGYFKDDLRDGFGELLNHGVVVWKGEGGGGEKKVRELDVIEEIQEKPTGGFINNNKNSYKKGKNVNVNMNANVPRYVNRLEKTREPSRSSNNKVKSAKNLLLPYTLSRSQT